MMATQLDGTLVLVADDDANQRREVARRLQAAGARVALARDGKRAMRAALDRRPDAAVLDVDMPGLNGYQVCRLLRDEPRTRRLPLVLLCEPADAGAAIWGRSAGADAVISKDRLADELLPALDAALAAADARAEPPPAPGGTQLAAASDIDLMARLVNRLDRDLVRATILNEVNALAAHIEHLPRTLARLGELLRGIAPVAFAALTLDAPSALYTLYPLPEEPAVFWERAWRLASWAGTPPTLYQPRALLEPDDGAPGALGDTEPSVIGVAPGWRLILWSAPGQSLAPAAELLETFGRAAALVVSNARLHAEVQRLALTDDLTGLFNRRYLQVRLETELQRAARTGGSLGVILFDLDHFKGVNDRFGHLAGDAVLRAAASALGERLRPYDLIGRFGGEEFVILAPGSTLDGATRLAERARGTLNALRVPGVDATLSASFGVTASSAGQPDADTLLRQADDALYRAKAAGRNRVEAWSG